MLTGELGAGDGGGGGVGLSESMSIPGEVPSLSLENSDRWSCAGRESDSGDSGTSAVVLRRGAFKLP